MVGRRALRPSARAAAPIAREDSAVLWVALVIFAGALAVYAFTLAPTVTLVDSGELIVAAWSAGVPHPPGFPLYTMLAHLATRLPVGEVAARVNFASALFAALAAAVVGVSAAQLVRPRIQKPGARTEAPASRMELGLAAATAGLLLAVSRAFWGFATVAEVYTLNTLLLAAVVYFVLRWRSATLAGARDDRGLVVAAGLFGLALGVHHVTVLVWAPGLAFLAWRAMDRRWPDLRRWGTIAGAFLVGLSVYAYLPLAAARDPLLNWGDPDSPVRFYRHVSGWIYQVHLSADGATLGAQVQRLWSIARGQFGAPWLPLGLALIVAGTVRLARRDRALLGALALVAGCSIAYALAYDIAEDLEAYCLPLFVASALVAGAGAVEIHAAAHRRGRGFLALIAAAAAVAVALVGNFPFSNRRGDFVARDYVRNTLASIERGGMLLTEEWQLYSPLLYTQEVAGRSRDVVAIDVNLVRRSWYVESIQRRHRELFAAAASQAASYLDDLRAWEADPQAYVRDARLATRIDGRYRAFVLALVAAQARSAPVYVTPELVVGGSGLAQALASGWQPVPEGLVFRLYADGEFHPPPELVLDTRSLTAGTRRTAPDDVVETKVRPAYAGMLVNRGLYLAAHERLESAREAAAAALALAPQDARARRLADRLAAQGGP